MFNGTDIRNLVQAANPACLLCHGRAVIGYRSPGDWVPYGSTTVQMPDTYEEDLCRCLALPRFADPYVILENLYNAMDALPGNYLGWTLVDALHWGCRLCALEDANAQGYDEQMYIIELEGRLKVGARAAQLAREIDDLVQWAELPEDHATFRRLVDELTEMYRKENHA